MDSPPLLSLSLSLSSFDPSSVSPSSSSFCFSSPLLLFRCFFFRYVSFLKEEKKRSKKEKFQCSLRVFLSSFIPSPRRGPAIRFQPYLQARPGQATLSTRLRPFSTCIFIRCVNNYRGHKTWYTADADLYIGAAIDAPSHGWSAVWLADRSTDLLLFSMNIRPRRTVLPSCV